MIHTKKLSERITIDKVDHSNPSGGRKESFCDFGRRRHLSYSMDFDTRAYLLKEPKEGWSEEAKCLHLENRERIKASLSNEFGNERIKTKIENFEAMGIKPFSIVSYHNQFFDQARNAFVIGAYFPALVSVCALGERILNHLMIDLRKFYKSTPDYKKVYKKNSFDNWDTLISTLEAWEVLQPDVVIEFKELKKLRHRSIHFNDDTYKTLRGDAIAAISHMRRILEGQFTAFGDRPWFIKGTKGHIFIKREWEDNPFIKTFYLPTCPFVGPYFSISFEHGLQFHDHNDYGEGEWSDEEFATAYEARSPEQLAKTQ